jgi:co-chaperonin GroES (HSP10)
MPNDQVILPKEKIEKIKPATNYVLVKIDDPNEYRVTEGGLFLLYDKVVPVAQHANRMGTIISVCDKLLFSNKSRYSSNSEGEVMSAAYDSLENDTDIEVESGDKVWYSYIAGLNCTEFLTEEIEEDKHQRKYRITYKLLKYDQLRLRLRNNEYRTLNGNVIVTLDQEKIESSLIVERKVNHKIGTVKFSGTPNRKYKVPIFSDGEGVEVGEKIIMKIESNSDREFEYSVHGKLEKGLRIVRGCDVFGKVKDDKIHPLKEWVMLEVEQVRQSDTIITTTKTFSDRGTIIELGEQDELSKGDKVIFRKSAGSEIVFNDKKYLILRHDDILLQQTN